VCRARTAILTADPSSLKFDLRDHRAIVYDPNNPKKVRDELVRTMKAALDATSDPAQFIESAFGSSEQLVACRLEKMIVTIIEEAQLRQPVKVISKTVVPATRELALEVEDFLGSKVRAIFDINGILGTFRRT
jgi:hypothetical protein